VEPLPVEAVPGNTVPSNCPAPDMAARPSSGIVVEGPVVLVVKEAVLGDEAAIGIAVPYKRHLDPDWRVGQDAAAHKQQLHLRIRHVPSGRVRLRSVHRVAAGWEADHNQGLAVGERAVQGAGAVVGMADAVVHRLSEFQHQQIETKGEKGSLHSL
jgi:hypothetical protein